MGKIHYICNRHLVKLSTHQLKTSIMNIQGFIILTIVWALVALATAMGKSGRQASDAKWRREEKRARLEEEYAKNLKAWNECKRDFKRRMRKLLGR